jgi:hypothetical protein
MRSTDDKADAVLADFHLREVGRTEDGVRIVAGALTTKQSELLLALVAKWHEESKKIRARPTYVRSGYFAHGAERRTARRLHGLGLLRAGSEWHSTGATLYPSDDGLRVAVQLTGGVR